MYITFKGSMYALKRYTIILVSFLIILTSLIQILYLIFVGIKFKHENIRLSLWVPLNVLDVIMNILLLSLFIIKLRTLIVDNTDARMLSANLLHRKRYSISHKYLKLMSKFCVLGFYVVLFNQVFGIYAIYNSLINNRNTNNYVKSFVYLLRALEGFIDCAVLYLTFIMNKKLYYKLCYLCDQAFYYCLNTRTQKHLHRKILSISSDSDVNISTESI